MVSPESVMFHSTGDLHNQSENASNTCPYCLTKSKHPRLGRGETYVCGYKPYRCDVCNYATTTKGNLAIHHQSDKHLNNVQELEHANVNRIVNDSVNPHTEKTDGSLCQNLFTSNPLMSTIQYSGPDARQSNSASDELPRINSSMNVPSDPRLVINMWLNAEEQVNLDNMLSTEQFVEKLIETSPYPYACQVCCAFTTDQLETLLKHATKNRLLCNQDQLNVIITTHTNGVWLCRLCSYKSTLKANFQLHCKTEKHGQRLSLLLHICEGGPANQLRMLAAMPDFNQDAGFTGNVAVNPAIGNFQNTSPIQLVCLACKLATSSAHKFRIHCQCSRHVQAVKLFKHLGQSRAFLWTELTQLVLNSPEFMHHINWLSTTVNTSTTTRNLNGETNGTLVSPIFHLVRAFSQLRLVYICTQRCSQTVNQERNDLGRNFEPSFESMSKAISHWHSTEHQLKILTKNQFSAINSHSDSEDNSFSVHWKFEDKIQTVKQIASMIIKLFNKNSSNSASVTVSTGQPKMQNLRRGNILTYPETVPSRMVTETTAKNKSTAVDTISYHRQVENRYKSVNTSKNADKFDISSSFSIHPTESHRLDRSYSTDRVLKKRRRMERSGRVWNSTPNLNSPELRSNTRTKEFLPMNFLPSSLSSTEPVNYSSKSNESTILDHASFHPMNSTSLCIDSIKCQLCASQIPTSTFVIHMAMHFMELSNSFHPSTEINEARLENVDSVAYTTNTFYARFAYRPMLRQGIILSTALLLKSHFPHLSTEQSEAVFLLALETLAQNAVSELLLYRSLEEKWFQLTWLKLEQDKSNKTCYRCNAPFVLSQSLELHEHIYHNTEGQTQAVLDFKLFNLLREIVESLERINWFKEIFDIHQVDELQSNSNSRAANLSPLTHPLPVDSNKFEGLTDVRQKNNLSCSISNNTHPSAVAADMFSTNDKQSPIEIQEFNRLEKCYTKAVDSFCPTPQKSDPPKRIRTRLSDTQLSVLRSYFDINNSPSDEKLAEICDKTGLQAKVVKHWFRNTLFKERQRNKDNPYNFSVPPSTSLNLEVYEMTGRIEIQPTAENMPLNHSDFNRPSTGKGAPLLSPESSNCHPIFGNSEASSENLSIPTDTDSSSIVGFPVTPPVKRLSERRDVEDESKITKPQKRPCIQSSGYVQDLRKQTTTTSEPLSQPQISFSPKLSPPLLTPASCLSGYPELIQFRPHSDLYYEQLLHNASKLTHPLECPQQLPFPNNAGYDSGELDAPLDLSTSNTCPTSCARNTVPTLNHTNLNSFGARNHRNTKHLSANVHSFMKHADPNNTPHHTSNHDICHGARRNRTSITLLQSKCMHSIYVHHKTPSVHECDRLGAVIGLSRRVVQVWFQNQRAKEKKLARVSSVYPNSGVSSSQQGTNLSITLPIDPSYCHLCFVPIHNDNSIDSRRCSSHQSNTLTSHASFVDHLFSHSHLKNMVHWYTSEVNNNA